MKEYQVKDHAPSFLPDGHEWKLAFADEFDGTELDRTKWDYRTSMMQREHPAWVEDGVHLDGNSNAVFTLMEKDGRPVSSQLQTGHNFMDEPKKEVTKFGSDHLDWPIGKLKPNLYTHTYGYYECRCRLQAKEGWWSAFWMQSPVIGCSLDPAEAGVEIDIMECFHPPMIAAHNIYCGGYGKDNQHYSVGGKMAVENPDEFHRFGVYWDKNGYTFYVDGVEDGHIDTAVSHRPEFILISTEAQGYRKAEHKPTAEALAAIGDTFLVDYVRVFDAIEE